MENAQDSPLLLLKVNACNFVPFLIYLDKKHVQLYFAAQFDHLSAKFAPEIPQKNVNFDDFCNFRYFDVTSLLTSQLRHIWSFGTLFGMVG